MAPSGADLVRTFIEAFDAEDLDAMVAVLDPEAEIQTSRGIVIGHDEARRWATRNPDGHLRQRLLLDAVRDEGAHAIAFARRQWWWKDHDELAGEDELAILATLRDGLIVRWQPFEDPEEALRAAGISD